MYYEINVARYGKHFFATAERSIRDMEHCKQVAAVFEQAFPRSEGYSQRISYHTQQSVELPLESMVPNAPTTRVPMAKRWQREDLEPAAKVNPEACPGCGCMPGDGETAGCTHPEGCGFYRQEAANG